MIRTENCDCAFMVAYYADYGTFGLRDGSVVSGPIFNVESEYDDPDGIGCIDVLTNQEKNSGTSVYADQLAWAEFPDVDAGDLPERLRGGE